tara:strand:- start:1515 stop:1856 length:342 start_codon:yes stop_codon:yes gene_type:complete
MNIFDSLKKQAFDVVTDVMGYNATWLSESITHVAKVGFKDPSEKQELSGISSWNPDEPFMEYRIGFFDNLKIRVDTANLEHVTIEGIGYFAVVEVKTKYDGETFIARLRHATP